MVGDGYIDLLHALGHIDKVNKRRVNGNHRSRYIGLELQVDGNVVTILDFRRHDVPRVGHHLAGEEDFNLLRAASGHEVGAAMELMSGGLDGDFVVGLGQVVEGERPIRPGDGCDGLPGLWVKIGDGIAGVGIGQG